MSQLPGRLCLILSDFYSNLAREICAPRADAVRHHLHLRTRAHPRGALYQMGDWTPTDTKLLLTT